MGSLTVDSMVHDDVLFEFYRRSPGPTERLPAHAHAEYQLSIGVTVRNAYEHRAGVCRQPPGRLTILPPGLAHRPAGPAVNRREAQLLLVYVPVGRVRDVAHQMTGKAMPALAGPVVLEGRMARSLRVLHRDLSRGSIALERDERLLAIVAATAATHGEAGRAPISGAAQARAVARARAFLHEHACEEVGLERLAREAGSALATSRAALPLTQGYHRTRISSNCA